MQVLETNKVVVMSLTKDLVFLVLQFLNDENLSKTAHMLECETGYFFNMHYFEGLLLKGNWDEAEKYLSGFTRPEDNKYSTKIYFEIRKQKYFEALDKKNHAEALNILNEELKVFRSGNEELFKDIAHLLTFDDLRDHELLCMYGDAQSARKIVMVEIKKIIEANPLFRGKLQFPYVKNQRLRHLINQSLNWQHTHCENPQPGPDIKTLFVDHVCKVHRRPDPQSSQSKLQPSQDMSEPFPAVTIMTRSPSSTVTHSADSAGVVYLRRPRESGDAMLNGLKDSDNAFRKMLAESDEVWCNKIQDEVKLPTNYPGRSCCSIFDMPDDLPKTVARTLNEGSFPMSMDFHPVQQLVLLVGTTIGAIGLWDVGTEEKMLSKDFMVWDINACSTIFKEALDKDPVVSVSRVVWSHDGSLFGVAYSKHLVQLYSYWGFGEVRPQLEIEAHVGSVNDIAFSTPDNQHFIITCGDDKTIKVWDVSTGAIKYVFEGHEAPVYSVYPHTKERIAFIFSTSVDGKIKAWLYDNMGTRVDYDAPGGWCTTMAYSADGKRLFSCGSSKEGGSFLVEWDENEGYKKRIYQGLMQHSLDLMKFDTIKNRFLAVGDEHLIKFWDMDKTELLTTIDADGCLPVRPHICFNKEGQVLAVAATDNRIKILATNTSLHLLLNSAHHFTDASKLLSHTMGKLSINEIPTVAGTGLVDSGVSMGQGYVKSELNETAKGRPWVLKLYDLTSSSQCQSLRLPAHVKTYEISRLIYTNAGNAILALASDAIHILWKWPQNDINLSGQVTTMVYPQIWKPKAIIPLMANDLTGANPKEAVPCFALSKNDWYLMSASGGTISLFNMVTSKRMTTFMSPPPAATFLAFHPHDNNIIAIGMDDSTILIYNVQEDEVESKLEGHTKRISGLAFSHVMKLLVSSGADAQIIMWNSIGWEKRKSGFLKIPTGEMTAAPSDTRIQFHQDQIHLLAVHDSHLAIYETTKLECVKQWVPGDFFAQISCATFSCDSQLVYACFIDGNVCIFSASDLQPQCRISCTAYLPFGISSNIYPAVIAAHPQKPYQFALGLTDGGVHVVEPAKSSEKWPSFETNNVPAIYPVITLDLNRPKVESVNF